MTRPSYLPYHDVFQTNIPSPTNQLLFVFGGYPAGLPVPSADHNFKLNKNYQWHAYLDMETLRNDDWLSSTNVALTTSQLTYANGDNVLTTGAVVSTYASYMLNNNRVEIDDAALNQIGGAIQGSPLVFPSATAPGRIWVYVNSAGVTRFESVAAATPDNPVGSEITLVGLDIAAGGIVTDGAVVPVTLPLPDYQLNSIVPWFLLGTDTMLSVIAGDAPGGDPAVFFDGQSGTALSAQANSVDPVAVFKQTGAGHAVLAQGSVSITTSLTASGNCSLGTGAGNTLITIGNASADVLSVIAETTFTNLVTCNGNVVIGNVSADTLTVVATSTFENNVSLGTAAGNKTITIGADALDTCTCNAASTFNANINFGANTITGAGGTITTSTVNSTVVVPTEIRYNTGVGAAPTANGRTGYDGRSLTIGDGTAARQYHTPTRKYVDGDTTTLVIEDITGASITMDIGNDEWVYFRLSAAHILDVGDTFLARLAATNGVDNVVTLNSGDIDVAQYGFTFGANQRITQSILVRWKPTNDIPVPNNTNWTIYARHGISGGNTLTTSGVEIQGWYEPT